MPHHVSKNDFARLVEEALSELPQQFAEYLEEVPIEIHDRPTAKQLRSVGLSKDQLLLGLYVGTALPDRSVSIDIRMPDKIYLFQDDIELACDSKEDLKREVRTTVLHEIGHHFGLDEDDLEKLGYG